MHRNEGLVVTLLVLMVALTVYTFTGLTLAHAFDHLQGALNQALDSFSR